MPRRRQKQTDQAAAYHVVKVDIRIYLPFCGQFADKTPHSFRTSVASFYVYTFHRQIGWRTDKQ